MILLNSGAGETLASPLDCKKIEPVHPKGDLYWVFFERTDAETETPIHILVLSKILFYFLKKMNTKLYKIKHPIQYKKRHFFTLNALMLYQISIFSSQIRRHYD